MTSPTTEQPMDDYYENRRHERHRARLWSEFMCAVARSVIEAPIFSVDNPVQLSRVMAVMADAMLAEYDRRWPRQKDPE